MLDVSTAYRPPAVGPSTGRVAVYREEFLPRSETFVRDHLMDMPRYSVAALTNELVDAGLEVPGVPVHLTRGQSVIDRAAQFAGYRMGSSRVRMIQHATSRTLHALRPDVVHAHFGPDAALIADATTRLHIPLVATFHGFDLTKDDASMRGQRLSYDVYLERGDALFQQLAAIITVSGFLRDILLGRGVDPSKISVIACGVDTSEIPWTPPVVDGPVVFVGRLTKKKGLDDLIRALSSMSHPPELVVIGAGPGEEALVALATELNVDVDFRGARSSTEVAAAIRRSCLVAMPSKRAPSGDSEGLPVVALEAGAAGRPVVGYAHSGIPEAVLDGVSGDLVPEGDVAGLAAAISALRADPDRALRYGRAGREHVERHFERQDLLHRVADVYDRVNPRMDSSS